VGEAGDGERLQPDSARASERREKDAVAAEDQFLIRDALIWKETVDWKAPTCPGGRVGVRGGESF